MGVEQALSALLITTLFAFSTICFFVKTRKNIGFEDGFIFGCIFFIYIPLLYFAYGGILPIDELGFGATELKTKQFDLEITNVFYLVMQLFCISVWYGLQIQPASMNLFPRSGDKADLIRTYALNIPLKLLAGIFAIIYIMLSAYFLTNSGFAEGGGHWYKSRAESMADSGSVVLLVFMFQAVRMLLIAVIFSSIVKLMKERKSFFKVIALIVTVFGVGVYEAFSSGNRLYLFIILALFFVNYARNFTVSKILLLVIIVPLTLAIGAVGSLYMHFRGAVFSEGLPNLDYILSLVSKFDFSRIDISQIVLGAFESVNLTVLLSLINSIDFSNMLWGESYVKFLFILVPRWLWPGKPETITHLAANHLTAGSESLSLAVTFLGELYFNFGYMAILFSIPLLHLLKNLTSVVFKVTVGHSSLGDFLKFCFGILFFRMAFSDIFSLLFVLGAALFALRILTGDSEGSRK